MADVPMERVIDAIEKQSSYLFAIDANVNISQKVSVSCTDASVETALTQMSKEPTWLTASTPRTSCSRRSAKR